MIHRVLPQPTRRLVVLAVLLGGCGNESPRSAPDVVKEWGEAVNARDWARACELSAAPRTDCEARLRRDFARADLRFDGPATNGGAMQPGEEYFGFSDHPRAVFVTAVPEDGDFRVRVEAVITR